MASPTKDSYDTVVVGAGPAGAMAALAASARGPVLLVDSSTLPRDKSCGGMIHEDSQAFLRRFGPIPESIVLAPRHVNFRYVDWDRGIRKATGLRFINVDRAGFDSWLVSMLPDSVELAGACSLETFSEDADGVTLSLRDGNGGARVRCNNLIGSDGSRSQVRRTLGTGTVSTYVTLQDYVELGAHIEPFFDCVYTRTIGDEFAYGYIVPKGDAAIIGTVYYPKTKRPLDKHAEFIDLLRGAYPQLGATVKREAATALGVRSTADTVPGAGRVLLAGEAGGFMSPTSGEGISYALMSGAAAGEAVASCAPDAVLPTYDAATRHLRRDIRRRLRWLPVMESPVGKYVAGLMPEALVSRVTMGL